MPKSRRSGGSGVMSLPSSSTTPALGATKPAMVIRMVVLPLPDGPSSVRKAPRGTLSETASTAVKRP